MDSRGWLLSWFVITDHHDDEAEDVVVELGIEIDGAGIARIERFGDRDVRGHQLQDGACLFEPTRSKPYGIFVEEIRGGWWIVLRLQGDAPEDAGWRGELAIELGDGRATARDLWASGTFRRGDHVFDESVELEDGDELTLASRDPRFRLRLKRLPVVFVIDGTGMTTRSEVWDRYVRLTQMLPSGFGRNLDAFWDAVQAGGPGWPGACRIRFVGCEHIDGGKLHAGLVRIAADLRGSVILELDGHSDVLPPPAETDLRVVLTSETVVRTFRDARSAYQTATRWLDAEPDVRLVLAIGACSGVRRDVPSQDVLELGHALRTAAAPGTIHLAGAVVEALGPDAPAEELGLFSLEGHAERVRVFATATRRRDTYDVLVVDVAPRGRIVPVGVDVADELDEEVRRLDACVFRAARAGGFVQLIDGTEAVITFAAEGAGLAAAIALRGSWHEADGRLQLGLHRCELVRLGGRILGDGIAIARRLAAACAPGAIAASMAISASRDGVTEGAREEIQVRGRTTPLEYRLVRPA